MREPLASLNERSFDVAVIGGGINGAAAAQHLAGAGYSTLLVEKNDYASAASGRSSRVLHCGLRYLAPARSLWEHVLQPRRLAGRVRSAIESLREMGDIVKTMPERVRSLKFAMPIYRGMPYSGWHVDIVVAALGKFKKNGVGLDYRRYRKGDPNMPEVASWFRESDEIEGIVVFRDFQFVWPERICIDAVMDARRLGATVRNYTEALDFTHLADGCWEIRLQDSIERGTTAAVTAKIVVNTAGVWIDGLNQRAASRAVPSRKVIGVKGVHVLVRLPEIFAGQGVCALNRHNEAIFCLPWDENHYLGPTETVYEGDFEDVRPEEDDIEFLIAETNHFLPGVKLRRSDVQMAWAGVRPITYDPAYPKGRRLPFSVLHDLSDEGLPRFVALTWGTVNLHRVSARNILQVVGKRLTPSGAPMAMDQTASRFAENQNSPPVIAEDPEIKLTDLVFGARNEDATNLVDLLFRRTAVGWRPTMRREDVKRAAEAVADELGWDGGRIAQEIGRYCAYVERQHLARVI